MNKNDFPKIPSETIELFSWQHLKNHYKIQPIIRKYFGEIGVDLIEDFGRSFRRQTKGAENFIREVNSMPPNDLLDEGTVHPTTLAEAVKYIFDRPYYFLFTNDQERVLFYFLLTRDTEDYVNNPAVWSKALNYIRYYNKNDFNYNDGKVKDGMVAVNVYLADYTVKTLGDTKLDDFLKRFLDFSLLQDNAGHLYDLLARTLGISNLEDLFLKQKINKVDISSVEDFNKLFAKPQRIEFTAQAHQKISQFILDGTLDEAQIMLYLSTYGKPANYVVLYPVLKHVLKTTNSPSLFYKAGDLLNSIWQTLPSDIELNQWFEKEIYDIYWPRIGGIWAIEHYDMLRSDAKNSGELYNYILYLDGNDDIPSEIRDVREYSCDTPIIEDSLGWILCLDNLGEFNQELKGFLENKAQDNIQNLQPKCLRRHLCNLKYKGSDISKVYSELSFTDNEALFELMWHPDTNEGADFILNKILHDDSVFVIFNRLEVMERLLLSRQKDGIKAYILQYLVKHFSIFSASLENNYDYIISMFTAACNAACENDEIEPLEKMAEKCKSIDIPESELQCQLGIIDSALVYAKDIVKRYDMQRKDLAKNLRKHTEEVERQLSKERSE